MRAELRTFRRARELRKALNKPETVLWTALSRGRVEGLKFRKQHPVGPFILDFYCPAAKLAVELDGEGHGLGDRPRYDARRDAWLRERGIETLRIPAMDVLRNREGVVGLIAATALARVTAPPPALRATSPARGGGPR